jgi:endonuclease I
MNGRAEALREQLTELLSNHKALDYSELWKAFEEIDSSHPTGNGMCKNHQINDIYSDKCWRFKKDQCGKFSEEGDCFNREHSWPKSWWGGDDNNAYSDLFHLFPSDGYNNNIRSNNPLGRVDRSDVLYKTNSGCLSGACADLPGSTCWEPADKWKGVLARAYLYMSVAYRNTFQCCDKEQVNGYAFLCHFPKSPFSALIFLFFSQCTTQTVGSENHSFVAHQVPADCLRASPQRCYFQLISAQPQPVHRSSGTRSAHFQRLSV